MDNDKISSVQWLKGKSSDSTWTDSNKLSKALYTQPHMYPLVASTMGYKSLSLLLTAGSGRFDPNPTMLGNAEYVWRVSGELTVPQPIGVSATPPVDSGKNKQLFSVPVAERYFHVGTVIRFQDSEVHARIQEIVDSGDGGAIYKCKIVSDDPNTYVPARDLQPNKLIVNLHTAFEEFSNGGGSYTSSDDRMKGQMTILRSARHISGSAATDVMVLEIKTANGKVARSWMDKAEFDDMVEWERELNIHRFYSKSNSTVSGENPMKGTNGNIVRIGDGIRESLGRANTLETTDGASYTQFMDFFTDLQIAAKEAENSHWVIPTGSLGLQHVNNIMLTHAKAFTAIEPTQITTLAGNKLQYDASRFRSFKTVLGSTITFIYNPIQDDPTKFTSMYKNTNKPIESGSMYVIDMSTYAGEPNLSVTAKEGRALIRWDVEGALSMSNFSNGTAARGTISSRASGVDGASRYTLAEQGTKLTVPKACGLIKLSPNY